MQDYRCNDCQKKYDTWVDEYVNRLKKIPGVSIILYDPSPYHPRLNICINGYDEETAHACYSVDFDMMREFDGFSIDDSVHFLDEDFTLESLHPEHQRLMFSRDS